MSEIEFRYSYSVDHEALDAWGDQQVWDEAEQVSRRFRLALIQFWSKATPKRRAEAKRNVDVLKVKP